MSRRPQDRLRNRIHRNRDFPDHLTLNVLPRQATAGGNRRDRRIRRLHFQHMRQLDTPQICFTILPDKSTQPFDVCFICSRIDSGKIVVRSLSP